ncbi:DegV family protein [Halanaerobium salsuginis]|jgi:DegV family protein with EDD domain|uniref:EDD domain protein, DegV family n=1 Tax=Halanaerobium salsuginis TaxID=29563 RepID=A0A1I4JWM7_9FIRM|nr:DegV family protein [Halanaerobium salsuginis]SFL70874.1 EDD domain protein, DegV family [Halanaerobium salsuginis]
MSIGIVTDSTCDLDTELISKYQIEVVPLSVHFGEEIYQDGIDINADSFFSLLKNSTKLPHTSRPAPNLFIQKYKNLLKKHEQIISIHVAKALSGTFESAKLAAAEFPVGKITVVDSATISLGLGMLVNLAAELSFQNKSAPEIVALLKKARQNLFLYFTVKDLTYMEKGGRIGKASSFLGSIFKINPVISINSENGKVEPVAKARGERRAMDKIIKLVLNKIENEQNIWLGFAHGRRENDLNKTKNKLLSKIKQNKEIKLFNSRISPTLGCHVGPTVYAVLGLSGDFLSK